MPDYVQPHLGKTASVASVVPQVSLDLASFELVRNSAAALRAILADGLVDVILANAEEAEAFADVASSSNASSPPLGDDACPGPAHQAPSRAQPATAIPAAEVAFASAAVSPPLGDGAGPDSAQHMPAPADPETAVSAADANRSHSGKAGAQHVGLVSSAGRPCESAASEAEQCNGDAAPQGGQLSPAQPQDDPWRSVPPSVLRAQELLLQHCQVRASCRRACGRHC